VFIFSVIF